MNLKQLWALLLADVKRLDPAAQRLRGRHFANPRFMPVVILRLARYCYLHKNLRFLSPVFTWANVLFFGIEVTSKCDIGGGLLLPHTHGTVIGAWRIGTQVDIYQGVTLGAKYVDFAYLERARPVLGDGVVIGAGAKVLGGITLGAGAKVAANSLVIEDVAAGVSVIGVPATVREGAV
jgi:serine O-acetyltransferase